ncbi:MAG: hypothetical protein C4B59_11935 [Candidatus Methanogaster sp.]|uniref:Uncharacterized protein n=1 Tax=Candidatus Methanogaster sp. TaxID=3386292 RepID=A0AC61L0G6_9EURY|nr:MAG: hypothetical protein C4B59_11935 [ANME-2 cluster archaeon]
MVSLREKVDVELENVSTVLDELEKIKDEPSKTLVELAGIGTFLHNFYTGIENILKQILHDEDIPIPFSDSWHRDLLILASKDKIITETTRVRLAKYLAFRHFFVHAYSFLLDERELKLLVDDVFDTHSTFKEEINAFISDKNTEECLS